MKPSFALRAFAPALAALLALSSVAHADEAPIPRLEVDSTTISASDEFQWSISFVVRNTLPVGLYLDSLSCEIEELDSSVRPPRHTTVSLNPLLDAGGTISSGDTGGFNYGGPAIAERARLTFRMGTHGANGTVYKLETVVTAEPSPYALAHPSELVAARGKKVEIVALAAEPAGEHTPGLLLLHNDGGEARQMFRLGQMIARTGYNVVLVSLPGSGRSEGPADLGGPATVAALEAALDKLKAMPGTDPAKLGAWGVSRGASAVASLAAKRADLGAAVLQSGLYDLWAGYRAAVSPAVKSEIVALAGRDSAAWRERSPIFRAGSIKGSVFVLHGEKDTDAPLPQAQAFVAALQGAGVNAEAKYFPAAQHTLPRSEAQRTILTWLRQHLGS